MTNKRKHNQIINSLKKQKTEIIFKECISASALKNFINNDPIIDYLSYWNINSVNDKPIKIINKIKPKNNFLEYLLENGITYENNIYNYLKSKFEIIQIFKEISDLNETNFKITKDYLNNGVPIIYQGVLYNNNNNTYGIPDLIIRSDVINTVFPNSINSDEEFINNKFYYFVVDIKNSTINLDKTCINVLNSNNLPFYKTQLLLYTLAISNILNINITKAFIFGRRYKSVNEIINNDGTKVGVIDYKNIDFNYYDKLTNSLEWIKRVRNEGYKWKLLPKPTVPELYPNMKNNKDFEWRPIKNNIANKINELTMIWNVGVKNRNIAHSNKIYSWKNKRCNSNNLGIKTKKGLIIDKIININRSPNKKIEPKKINYNNNLWKKYNFETMEFYVDYETLCKDEKNYIYMIGVGYYIDKWEFKTFYLKNLSDNDITLMFKEFWDFINDTLKQYNKNNSQFIHWTKAEPSQYNKYIEKFMLPNKNFIDLFEVFKNEPIVIKGAMNFSLKEVSKAMYNLKLIETTWENKIDTTCSNGQDALYLGIKLYDNLELNSKLLEDNVILNEITKYNEVDCKVLYEIINYLRKKHI